MINTIIQGDSREKLKTIKSKSIRCAVTSPPYYGLRDYGVDGQIGLEHSPEEYVQQLVDVFQEVKRILTDDGTLWLNLGDSYWANRSQNGVAYDNKTSISENHMLRSGGKHDTLKPKDLIGIPWMVAFALRADGWYLRSDIIWSKPNCMPESVADRPTKAHEYLFLLSKQERYYYNHEAIKEKTLTKDESNRNKDVTRLNNTPGRSRMDGLKTNDYDFKNKRSVWTVPTASFSEAHFATFPEKLIEPCILAGSEINDTILDPFFGAGTTGLVSLRNGRNFIGVELNPEYIEIADSRLSVIQPVINF